MRGRDVFLESLKLHGVTRIFGNPGTTESPLLDNLADHPEIEYIIHLHEGVAVGAANIYAQVSGGTAVSNMHVAPGLGNAIGMMYGALKNSSPMIVTAGAQDTRIRLNDPVLGHDLAAMAAPVAKWSVQVEHADEMALIMQRAFKIANTHPAGPVFVALPINVMEQETTHAATRANLGWTRSPAPPGAVQAIVNSLESAAAPVIVAGDDVVRAGAGADLVALAEKIGAPVYVELLTGRVAFPTDHPHFRGRLGPDARAMNAVLRNHDTVLMIGGPFFEEIWWSDASPFGEGSTVIHLEETPTRLGHVHVADVEVSGDIARVLEEVLVTVSDAGDERRTAVTAQKTQLDADAEARFNALKDRSPMTPTRALAEIASHIDANAIVVDESITASLDVVRQFRFGAGHDYFGGRGGGIGQGIAGSIGAAVAATDRQVVAISGDGSAMYSVQALWTAAHHDLDILFIILSNREYRVLKHNIDQYRRRFDAPSNKPYPHMDLSKPTLGFVDMAKGMGVAAEQVTGPADIGAAIARSRETTGPYLVDVVVEGMETR